jgi:hypothetical protein
MRNGLFLLEVRRVRDLRDDGYSAESITRLIILGRKVRTEIDIKAQVEKIMR